MSLSKNFFSFGSSVDKKPEPSFWPPVMVISHRDVIQTIQQSKQLNSEVGYCRAWIRLSLNDGLISSYLENMRSNNRSLGSYYHKFAFLRDGNVMEVTIKVLEMLEAKAKFDIPFNSSLMNEWPTISLDLAGIWSVAVKSTPVEWAGDVAGSLPTRDYQNEFKQLRSRFGLESLPYDSSGRTTPVSHDFARSETGDSDILDLSAQIDDDKTLDETMMPSSIDITEATENTYDHMTLSIITTDEFSSATLSPKVSPIVETPEMEISNIDSDLISIETTDDHINFDSLVNRYKLQQKDDLKQGIREIWQSFENHLLKLQDTSDNEEEEWEQVDPDTPVSSKKFKLNELHDLVQQVCKLGNESGLSIQDYKCHNCTNPIGVEFKNAQICRFSGFYYCNQCMSNETFQIPARVIFNWDFKWYSVSEKAASFFKEFRYEPFIDLQLLNPNYTTIHRFKRLLNFRVQLKAMGSFMITCDAVANEFKEKLNYRDYFYTSTHKYSIADMEILGDGQLEKMFKSVVEWSRAHILTCPLCSQKGFICEICNDSTIIYPFDVDSTFQCDSCKALYHLLCFSSAEPCKKCERKKQREVKLKG